MDGVDDVSAFGTKLHKVAVNVAARGTLRREPVTGVRNLLTNTPFAGAVSGTPGTAPTDWPFNASGGSTTATTGAITFSATAARQIIGRSFSVAASQTQTWRVKVTSNPNGLTFNQLFAVINPDGVSSLAYYANGGLVNAVTYVPLANEVLSAIIVNGGTPINPTFRIGVGASANATGTATFTEPQIEIGSTATAYQRVTNANDITEAGVASTWWIKTDGINTGYVTPAFDPGVDKMQVFVGARKLSDAARGIVVELGPDGPTNRFIMQGPIANGSATYGFSSLGTLFAAANSPTIYAAPTTNVLTGIGDISGDLAALQVDGVQVAQSTGDQGTGNFGNYPLYFYRRGGTSLPFNGQSSIEIVRFGTMLSPELIAQTNAYVGGRIGKTL